MVYLLEANSFIEYTSDIAEVWPNKRVTLLHSRKQLLPRFNKAMHEESTSIIMIFTLRSCSMCQQSWLPCLR